MSGRKPRGAWRDTGANMWVIDLSWPGIRLFVERDGPRGAWWWHAAGLPLYDGPRVNYPSVDAAKIAAEDAARRLLVEALAVIGDAP